MELILTHDQADFDAIASLVAARKLFPQGVAVRPWKVNSNVESYLALYEPELGLIGAEKLTRRGTVTRVILVDTQRVLSVRGVRPETPVVVFDHHPARAGLPPEWTAMIEPGVGSTTALLVEQLQAHQHTLTPIEATLLLLGIYEDTGNLTYLTTSARDAAAAAWVLGFAPDLTATREYLHRPLSEAQMAVYAALIQQSETLIINGVAVVVGAVSVPPEIELAPIVQKVRDTLNTPGVIGLFQLGQDVEMIGRSTQLTVDVGVVARALGGGGHGRAAAALIHNATIETVLAKVRAVLPEAVRLGVTVRQLMSRGAVTLDAAMTVREAAAVLQRYGHEGDLVTEADGTVVGLLTRKAVDRALSHGMAAAEIHTIMEGGVVAVSPETTVTELQGVMAKSGWGQIPVLEGGRLVGIVTRTDVMRHLGQPAAAYERNVAAALEAALPAARFDLLRRIAAQADELGLALYIVGGFVRDLLLQQPSLDFDLVVEGDAIALAHTVGQVEGGRVSRHARFGTAKWHLPTTLAAALDMPTLDFVSARQEFYAHPTALPEVERSSIKHDLHRRDFTINTLAVQVNGAHFGQLLDFYGGERDLQAGVIRVLHSLSFVEDPTRMLRAVRLAVRFGFEIEGRTAALLSNALDLLNRVSGDRLRHELEAIFKEQQAAAMLTALAERGVLAAIDPALTHGLAHLADWYGQLPANEQVEARRALAFVLWLGQLDAETIDRVRRRLNIGYPLVRTMKAVSASRAALSEMAADAPLSVVDGVVGGLDDLAWRALEIMDEPVVGDLLARYAARRAEIAPQLDGHDLMVLGYAAGPLLAEILGGLRRAWLDGEINTADEEVDWVRAHYSVG